MELGLPLVGKDFVSKVVQLLGLCHPPSPMIVFELFRTVIRTDAREQPTLSKFPRIPYEIVYVPFVWKEGGRAYVALFHVILYASNMKSHTMSCMIGHTGFGMLQLAFTPPLLPRQVHVALPPQTHGLYPVGLPILQLFELHPHTPLTVHALIVIPVG